MTADATIFTTLQPFHSRVLLADHTYIEATGIGEVKLVAVLPERNYRQYLDIRLTIGLLVHHLGRSNLLSWNEIATHYVARSGIVMNPYTAPLLSAAME